MDRTTSTRDGIRCVYTIYVLLSKGNQFVENLVNKYGKINDICECDCESRSCDTVGYTSSIIFYTFFLIFHIIINKYLIITNNLNALKSDLISRGRTVR